MVNLLNEEIMAIKHLIAHLEKAIPLEIDNGKKQHLKLMLKEAEKDLKERLDQCGEYKG